MIILEILFKSKFPFLLAGSANNNIAQILSLSRNPFQIDRLYDSPVRAKNLIFIEEKLRGGIHHLLYASLK